MEVMYKNQHPFLTEPSKSNSSASHLCSTTKYMLSMTFSPHLQYYPLISSSQFEADFFPYPTIFGHNI